MYKNMTQGPVPTRAKDTQKIKSGLMSSPNIFLGSDIYILIWRSSGDRTVPLDLFFP